MYAPASYDHLKRRVTVDARCRGRAASLALVPMLCAGFAITLSSPQRSSADQGRTCAEMGWYPAGEGGQCGADCGEECERKQWCDTGLCEPYPHYCWRCGAGAPPPPPPPPPP